MNNKEEIKLLKNKAEVIVENMCIDLLNLRDSNDKVVLIKIDLRLLRNFIDNLFGE